MVYGIQTTAIVADCTGKVNAAAGFSPAALAFFAEETDAGGRKKIRLRV